MRVLKYTLLAGALCAGCRSTPSPEQAISEQQNRTRNAIREVITDPVRRDAMLAIINEFESDLHRISAHTHRIRDLLSTALRTRDTTDDEIDSLTRQLRAGLKEFLASSSGHSLSLREQCSQAEWERIFTKAADVTLALQGDHQ